MVKYFTSGNFPVYRHAKLMLLRLKFFTIISLKKLLLTIATVKKQGLEAAVNLLRYKKYYKTFLLISKYHL